MQVASINFLTPHPKNIANLTGGENQRVHTWLYGYWFTSYKLTTTWLVNLTVEKVSAYLPQHVCVHIQCACESTMVKASEQVTQA